MSVRVEICRPRQAAWVGTEGMGFDWAWRVTGPGGNVVTGLRKGSRARGEGGEGDRPPVAADFGRQRESVHVSCDDRPPP